MTAVIRSDGYAELHPDKGNELLDVKTGTRHKAVVCLPENAEKYDEVMALCVVLVIDAVMDQSSGVSVSVSSNH